MTGPVVRITPLRASDLSDPAATVARTATVQVWMLEGSIVEAAAQAFGDTLDDAEHRRAAAFTRPGDAQRFVARRGLLRALLAGRLGMVPASLRFENDAFGRPTLVAAAARGLQFSVSQTEGIALVALAEGVALGVDVERRVASLSVHDLAAEVFSAAERAELRALPEPDCTARFFATWARKEALLKALGVGLSERPADCETGPADRPPAWRARRGTHGFEDWHLQDLTIGPGLHAALAFRALAG